MNDHDEAQLWSVDDGTDDGMGDICDGYPEHRGVRITYEDDNGIQWECTQCGAEGWEDK